MLFPEILRQSGSEWLAAKSLQPCLTLCYPIDSSPPGSPVPGILQARTLEWVAVSFSRAWKWKVKVKSLSHVWLLATPWTAAYQAPLSMGFSRQEDWSGVPLPSPWVAWGVDNSWHHNACPDPTLGIKDIHSVVGNPASWQSRYQLNLGIALLWIKEPGITRGHTSFPGAACVHLRVHAGAQRLSLLSWYEDSIKGPPQLQSSTCPTHVVLSDGDSGAHTPGSPFLHHLSPLVESTYS